MLRATYMRVSKFFLFPICHRHLWGVDPSGGSPYTKVCHPLHSKTLVLFHVIMRWLLQPMHCVVPTVCYLWMHIPLQAIMQHSPLNIVRNDDAAQAMAAAVATIPEGASIAPIETAKIGLQLDAKNA